MLGTVASASILPIAGRAKTKTKNADPILSLITAHKDALDRWVEAYDNWDEAKSRAYKTNPPLKLEVRWHGEVIDFENINRQREKFSSLPFASSHLVASEFEKKYRELVTFRAETRCWEKAEGLRTLMLEKMRADWQMHLASEDLGNTTPTSTTGAAALLDYVLGDSSQGRTAALEAWHMDAIEHVTDFLRNLTPSPIAASVKRSA